MPPISELNQLVSLRVVAVPELYNRAEKAYSSQAAKASLSNNSLVKEGTKRDKIASIAQAVIEKPESCLQPIQILVKWSFDKNPHFAASACQALAGIYSEHFLSEKSSLSNFEDSVIAATKVAKGKDKACMMADLVGFYLEHHVKKFYGEFIQGLIQLLVSTIAHIKKLSLKLLIGLARFSEMRRFILGTVINKIGDPDLETVNLTTSLLKEHFFQDILSCDILLEEVQAFLMRHNLSEKAQFYVLNYLNSINLRLLSQQSLTKTFELFYGFFERIVTSDKQGTLDSRLFETTTRGLNKVLGFLRDGYHSTKESLKSKMDSIHRIVHATGNTKTKVQLLLFLFQAYTHVEGKLTDRYYRTLYDFINNEEILHCSSAELFIDLLLTSLRQDEQVARNLAFLKRLLQICLRASTGFIIACLLLVSKLVTEKDALRIALQKKELFLFDSKQQPTIEDCYNQAKREPLHAGAMNTPMWELLALQSHHHPTVRKFTNQIIRNEPIIFEGNNPLLEFSLTSFVEKMCLRKDRKSEGWILKVQPRLSKIRKSKYQSLLDKDLTSFQDHEQAIAKYLERRASIIQRKPKRVGDIEDYADDLVQKEMQRLNPDRGQDDFQFSDMEPELESEAEDDLDAQSLEAEGEFDDEQNEADESEPNSLGSEQEQEGLEMSQEEDMDDSEQEEVDSDSQVQDFETLIDRADERPRYNPKSSKFPSKKRPIHKTGRRR